MKKLFLFSVLITFVTFMACDSKSSENKNGEKKSEEEKQEEIVEEEFLSPSDIDLTKPIPVKDLKEAFFAWDGQEVIITGYCDFFRNKGKIGTKVSLIESPEGGDVLVECNMLEDYEEEFDKSIPVTIKGVIDRDFFGRIILKDCELITKGEEAMFSGKINPFNPPKESMWVGDFFNSYFGWIGKEVSVIGYYFGTTTSTTNNAVYIRIDLLDPETREKSVGCYMIEDPDYDLANNRENVVIRGIIKGESFGNVSMEECELVLE